MAGSMPAEGSPRRAVGGRRTVDVDHLVERDDHPTYHVPVFALLYAVVAGPFIWMLHLSGASALAPLQCQKGGRWPVNVLTVVTGLAIVAAMVIGWRIHRQARAAPPSASSRAVAFISLVGFFWAAISLYPTLLEGAPNLVMGSCPR